MKKKASPKQKAVLKKAVSHCSAVLDVRIKKARSTLYAGRVSTALKIINALKPVLSTYRDCQTDKAFRIAVRQRLQKMEKAKAITASRKVANQFVRLVKVYFPKETKYIQNRYAGFLHFAEANGWPISKLYASMKAELKKRGKKKPITTAQIAGKQKTQKPDTFDTLCREGSAMAQEHGT